MVLAVSCVVVVLVCGSGLAGQFAQCGWSVGLVWSVGLGALAGLVGWVGWCGLLVFVWLVRWVGLLGVTGWSWWLFDRVVGMATSLSVADSSVPATFLVDTFAVSCFQVLVG